MLVFRIAFVPWTKRGIQNTLTAMVVIPTLSKALPFTLTKEDHSARRATLTQYVRDVMAALSE